MNKLKSLLVSSLVLSFPLCVNADEHEPNPADLTKVRTAVTLSVNDDSSGKLNVELSGKYNSKYSFMVKAEGEWNDEQEYSASRFQYYHVGNTGFAAVPKTALSYDYFRKAEDTDELDIEMHALGSISMVPLSKEWQLNLFPQLTYLHSTFDLKLGGKRNADGIMAAAYLTKNIGNNGSYFVLYPEYFKVSGDGVEYEQKNLSFGYGTPVTDSKKWWLLIEAKHKENETTFDGMGPGLVKDDNVTVMVRRFFF